MIRRGDDDPDEMLSVALSKARRLVAELEKESAELAAKPPDIPPDKLAQGKFAMDNAVASARRMLKSLEDAAAIREQEIREE